MKMQVKDLKKLIQNSILEVLNGREEETVTEEEEVETVTEEEETEVVTEDWGGSSRAGTVGDRPGLGSDPVKRPVQSSGHGTHSGAEVSAAIEKACADKFGPDYRECIKKKTNLYDESKDVEAEGDFIGENEEVIDEMGKAYKRDDDKEKLKEVEEEETVTEESGNKFMTPEREAALKENYMGAKRANLFERLAKKWAK